MLARCRSLIRSLVRRSTVDRDMAEELRFHLDARVDDLVESGMTGDEARRRARLEFGAVEAYKDACREAHGLRLIDDLRGDLRYAVRTLVRAPAFAVMATVSLALGIGANTVVFSIVNALVLRPLPVQRPERIVFVQNGARGISHSFPTFRDLRDRTKAFEALIGYRTTPIDFDTGTSVTRTFGYLATGNYFDALGIKPIIGRVFHQEDDAREGEVPFAVLSYDCWMDRFAGDPSVVGRTARLNRTPFTIIGVAPKGFRGTELFYGPDLWVPMMMEPQIEVGNPWLNTRTTTNTWIIGRLKDGVSAAAAAADLNAIAAQLAREYPRENGGIRYTLARPGLVGDALGRPIRAFTLGVLALAGLVLVIACANLASVLAARGADRSRELAIRVSIGAARGRIVRQLLTETLLISLVGGAAGCALAVVLTRALSAWHAPVGFPVQFDVTVDGRVLAFGCFVSLLAGVLFGIAPARQASSASPSDALKDTVGLGSNPQRWPLRDALVAVQVALSVVLVAACLLSLRGLRQALTMSIGMNPHGVTMVGFDLGLAGYTKTEGSAFQRRVLERVAALPGVASAAYSNSLPLSIDYSQTVIVPDDQPNIKPSEVKRAVRYEVSPRFFETLGIRRQLGREIEWRDGAGVPRVAVVNRTFARTIMRTKDPIGRHFSFSWRRDPVEIIGVVEDGKYWSLTESPQPAVFESILQAYNATTTVLVRSARPPEQLVSDERAVVAEIDPHLPLYQTGTVDDMLGFALFPSRAAAVALGAFGLLAIVLVATGIHGLVAYSVSRRRREIGIRLAIGASAQSVLKLVLGRIALLLAIGGGVGLVLAAAAGRLLAAVVYQASPHDPAVFATVAGVLALVGIASCWAPARKSLRIAPMNALRTD
jgi:predicted permease